MLERIISFFIGRHLLTNMVFAIMLICGIVSWSALKKEELPDITYDSVRISVNYPGASPEEVEYHVTGPIEERLTAVEDIYRLTSATTAGNAVITAELDPGTTNIEAAVTEIRQEVLGVDLPDAIRDEPRIRVFKTSRKAIIDIALFSQSSRMLDTGQRSRLQLRAIELEQLLLSLPEVSRIDRSGWLDNEIHISIDPAKLREMNIPFNTVMREIRQNNVREPAGSIEAVHEPEVTLYGELRTPEELRQLAIQGGFEGQVVRLGDIARVSHGHASNRSILKINGHEGIFLKVTKSSRFGILDALKAINPVVENFSSRLPESSPVRIIRLDDESVDLRNRLSLIGINGAIGFLLIIITLFIFLDAHSGLWVAMGIPFSLCFALSGALLIGYSINNITLAAVIIVMGIVVDDALVVAENIKRSAASGMPLHEAAARGTSMVFLPVTASIITTCIAFIPLLFFEGRFGSMVAFIPAVIALMLAGSLLEALFILPGHMTLTGRKQQDSQKEHWFHEWERNYARLLKKLLPFRWPVIICFATGFLASLVMARSTMNFVMFPDEETREIRLSGEAPPGSTQEETAAMTEPLEEIISASLGKEVIGFRTEIARSRRGSAVQENLFRMRIEIVPKEDRDKTADQLIREWEAAAQSITTLSKLKFSKTRHGQDSGSPIEIVIKNNNEHDRRNAARDLAEAMHRIAELKHIETDQPKTATEFLITLQRDRIKRLDIDPSEAASTLRAALEGTVLYEFSSDNEPVAVRLSLEPASKRSIESLLDLPVENKSGFLVPLGSVVEIAKREKPSAVMRQDRVRTTSIYADIDSSSSQSPLAVAEHLEKEIFPGIIAAYPSTIIEFAGEIRDSRESGKNFLISMLSVLVLVFLVLVILFNSMRRAVLIMLAIPFGLTGIIIALFLHGIEYYGFFAVIGALGLSGIIINDAIIMVTRLDQENRTISRKVREDSIAGAASTRLRAVLLTTLTTVAGMLPTAYGLAGYDPMLAQMMLVLTWGLIAGTLVTLVLVPCLYRIMIPGGPQVAYAQHPAASSGDNTTDPATANSH